MIENLLPTAEQEVEAVNARETLLLRVRGIARRVQERVWRLAGREEPQGPHQPTAGDNPGGQEGRLR
jgi:hypothetical protein